MPDSSTDSKLLHLKHVLAEMGRLATAYSGGTDSTLLLRVAKEVVGPNVVALTATSDTLAPDDLAEARALAEALGVEHVLIPVDEMSDPNFRANPPDRCYHCRRVGFAALLSRANAMGLHHLVDGSNADDLNDHRPGRKAAGELGVRSPLLEVGLSKNEIREIARSYGLPNWNKPASPCLASRVPYGMPVTHEVISQIRRAEAALKTLGLNPVRVRHHGDVARIEVDPNRFGEVLDKGDAVTRAIREAGFSYVTLDLQGFRSGSMNEVIRPNGH